MDWASIAKRVVAAGAPSIGGALFGPLGGMAGTVLANVLGVEPTPEAVAGKIETMPPGQVQAIAAEADAKFEAEARKVEAEWSARAKIVEAEAAAEARVAEVNVQEVNKTIRETASGDGLLGKWRGFHAWEFTAECPVWLGLIVYCVISGKAADLVALSGLIIAWWGVRGGIMGIHVYQGSKERQTAIRDLTNVLPFRAAA